MEHGRKSARQWRRNLVRWWLEQGSVITWAKNNNIRIYTIRLGTEASQTELMAYRE